MQALAIIPAYSHVDHRLMMALLEARVPFLPLYGSSDLPRARSMLISHALRQSPGRVLFMDSDVVPSREQIVELATTPLVTPTQAVTGLYPIRDVRATAAGGASWAVNAVDPETAGGKQIFEATWAGLGFAAVHLESLLLLEATLPEIHGDEAPWRPYCVPVVVDNTYYPDDRVLWQRLRNVGVGLVGCASLKIGHIASVVLREVG